MRLISCVALLMVIPAVALLKRGEDLTANKSKVADLHKTVKNNKPDLKAAYLSVNQFDVNGFNQENNCFKPDNNKRFNGSSYFSTNLSFTKQ